MADRKSFLVRLSPALFNEIQRLAEQDLRSINGEIGFLLRQAVEKRLGKRLVPKDGEAKEGEC